MPPVIQGHISKWSSNSFSENKDICIIPGSVLNPAKIKAKADSQFESEFISSGFIIAITANEQKKQTIAV